MNDRNYDTLGSLDQHAYDLDRDDDLDTCDTEDTDALDEIEDRYVVLDLDELEEEEEEEEEGEEEEDDFDDDGCDCNSSDRSSQRKPMISLPPDLVVRLLLLALAAVTGSQTVAWLHPAVEQMCDELDDLFHLLR